MAKLQNKTFSEKVLDIVKNIPKGKVLTYMKVAKLAGSPNASRAVGSILKKNYKNLIYKTLRVIVPAPS